VNTAQKVVLLGPLCRRREADPVRASEGAQRRQVDLGANVRVGVPTADRTHRIKTLGRLNALRALAGLDLMSANDAGLSADVAVISG